MEKIYFYKLTADSNAAPCIHYGLLSLAICKPMIRKTAKEGNLIIGFAANSLHDDNRLIFAARVTRKLTDGDYFKTKKYFRRGDCIYSFRNMRFTWRKDAKFHSPADLTHDLGDHPDYDRASVLLSEDFRYFGKDGNDKYKTKFPRVKCAVENLGRGHRVRHGPAVRDQLLEMMDELWRTYSTRVIGRPTGAAPRETCYRDGECGEA